MATVLQIFSKSRVYMGKPPHDKVTDIDLLTALHGGLDYYRTQMSNSNQGWFEGETLLTVDQNRTTYLLPEGPDGEIAKPLRVEYYDPTDPESHGPEIEMVLLQDIDLVQVRNDDWWSTFRTNSSNSSNSDSAYLASAMVFYDWPFKVRLVPRPSEQVTYRIYYDRIVATEPGLTTKPEIQANFHDMLAWHIADVNLPNCDWPDSKHVRHDRTIQRNLEKREAEFGIFRRFIKRPDTRLRRPFVPGMPPRHGQ